MTTRYLVLKCNLREQRVRAMVLQICRTDPIARLLMSGRITTQEIFMMLLSPMLRELHENHPEIMIELDDSQDFRDLGEGEADIALRSAHGDLGPGVVGRRLGPDHWTLYCSRDYAAQHG